MSKDRSNYYFEGVKRKDNRIIQEIKDAFYERVKSYIMRRGGNAEDADEIFFDAIIGIHDKTKKEGYEFTSGFFNFLITICKHIWLNKCRANKKKRDKEVRFEGYEVSIDEEQEAADLAAKELRYQLILEHTESLSTRCRKLIKFAQKNSDLEQLRVHMGFKNKSVVYQKRFKCLEKLKKYINSDPRYRLLLD